MCQSGHTERFETSQVGLIDTTGRNDSNRCSQLHVAFGQMWCQVNVADIGGCCSFPEEGKRTRIVGDGRAVEHPVETWCLEVQINGDHTYLPSGE